MNALPGNLPPRARKALLDFGIRTIAEAAGLSDRDLLRIKGVGQAAVEVIRREAPAAINPPDVVDPGHPIPTPALRTSDAYLAENFVHRLAEKHGLIPSIIPLAWDLAVLFDQERRRAEGVDIAIADGTRVRFDGKTCVVRTTPPPAGTKYQTVALVAAEE